MNPTLSKPQEPRPTNPVEPDLKILDLDKNHNIPLHTTNSADSNSDSNSDSDSLNSESLNSASNTERLRKSSSNTLRIEETVSLANLEIAQKYRDENTLRRLLNGKYEQYSVYSTTTSMLGEYGAGLELYFVFIKHLGYLFILISLLSAWPIYQNSQGEGLVRGAAKQEWSYWTVANQKQISLETLEKAENDLKLVSQNRIVMAIADSIGALCFAVFFVKYFHVSKKTVAENFKNNVTAADYAIEIKGLHEDLMETDQIKDHFEQFGEVVEVYLARKYFGMLQDYKERAQISNKLGYERIIAPGLGNTNAKKIKQLEEKLCKFDTEMHIRFKNGDIFHDKLPVNRAYLIFNKLENKKLCLDGCAPRSICFKKRKIEIERLFQGQVALKVKQTTEPSNILWENLEITRCERRWRKSLSFFLALAVLVGSTCLVYVIKTYETTLPTDKYCLEEKKIDHNKSLSYAKKNYDSNSESYCYCKYQEWADMVSDKELGTYCSYFMSKITTSLLLKFFSACGIIFINFILRTIFKRLSRFEKVSNKTKEEHNIMIKVFFAIFINTALIILIVNANFSRISALYKIPGTSEIFTGKYADFTREWYINIGESIIFTILICVISPHILTFISLYPLAICKRRCCHNRYKTQTELNSVFAGPQFDLACRNSQVLNLVFTSYLYSSAMPFLNIITMVALFCLYWTDKYLVLRHYKKPPLLSYHLNDAAIKFIPFMIILHCSFAIYMFGSEDIFPTKVYEKNGKVLIRKNAISNRLVSIPGAVHGFVIIFTVFLTLVIFFYSGIFTKCRRGAKVEAETQDSQGTYIDELEVIKKHGLHTYEILENLDYRHLILSLNSAAENVQTLRHTLTKRSEYLERLKKIGK